MKTSFVSDSCFLQGSYTNSHFLPALHSGHASNASWKQGIQWLIQFGPWKKICNQNCWTRRRRRRTANLFLMKLFLKIYTLPQKHKKTYLIYQHFLLKKKQRVACMILQGAEASQLQEGGCTCASVQGQQLQVSSQWMSYHPKLTTPIGMTNSEDEPLLLKNFNPPPTVTYHTQYVFWSCRMHVNLAVRGRQFCTTEFRVDHGLFVLELSSCNQAMQGSILNLVREIHLLQHEIFFSIGAKRVKAVCIMLHMCCDRQDQQGWVALVIPFLFLSFWLHFFCSTSHDRIA